MMPDVLRARGRALGNCDKCGTYASCRVIVNSKTGEEQIRCADCLPSNTREVKMSEIENARL